MKLVVGLGNPGPKYETTRHNVGFLAIDHLAECWEATGPKTECLAETWRVSRGGENVILAKPQTYMNESGKSVSGLATFYKVAPEDITVIYDDMDIFPGTIRCKVGGSAGGHNGLKSMDQWLGAGKTGYRRIRIGIGRPARNAVDHVLNPFTDEELSQLETVLDEVLEAVCLALEGKDREAMNRFNRKQTPEEKTQS